MWLNTTEWLLNQKRTYFPEFPRYWSLSFRKILSYMEFEVFKDSVVTILTSEIKSGFGYWIASRLRWYCLARCVSKATIRSRRPSWLLSCPNIIASNWFQQVNCFTYRLSLYLRTKLLNWVQFIKAVSWTNTYLSWFISGLQFDS